MEFPFMKGVLQKELWKERKFFKRISILLLFVQKSNRKGRKGGKYLKHLYYLDFSFKTIICWFIIYLEVWQINLRKVVKIPSLGKTYEYVHFSFLFRESQTKKKKYMYQYKSFFVECQYFHWCILTNVSARLMSKKLLQHFCFLLLYTNQFFYIWLESFML